MMTTEQRVQFAIGSQVVAIAQLQTELEEAKAKIAELEAKLSAVSESPDHLKDVGNGG